MKVALVSGLALSLTLGGGVTTSCSRGCGDTQIECMAPSLTVFFLGGHATHRTTICVNDECDTTHVVNGDQTSFTFADHGIVWKPGSSVNISISVVDAQGTQVASMESARKMTERECDCPAFWYRLDGGEFYQQA